MMEGTLGRGTRETLVPFEILFKHCRSRVAHLSFSSQTVAPSVIRTTVLRQMYLRSLSYLAQK